MEVCACCESLFRQLREHFRGGDDEQFYQIWATIMDGHPKNPSLDPNLELALFVRFKLKVYFAVVPNNGNQRSLERLSCFLREEGTSYAKFPELASYFALPYIINTEMPISHPIVENVRQDEWINELEWQWTQLLCLSIHHCHGFDEKKIDKQIKSHLRLKEKLTKLKEDHKMLLELATRLVTALEDSLRGEAACDLETFEYYNQEIKNMSYNMEESKDGSNRFQWEARSLKKSASAESIASKTSLE